MPQIPLSVDSTVPSGPVPPGTNFSFFLHRGGNKDDVPDTGFQWEVYHNGRPMSGSSLTALTTANIAHTFNRPRFGFRLKPVVRGLIEVRGSGHGLDQRWAYPIDKAIEPPSDTLQAALSRAAAAIQEARGLAAGLVK